MNDNFTYSELAICFSSNFLSAIVEMADSRLSNFFAKTFSISFNRFVSGGLLGRDRADLPRLVDFSKAVLAN